MSTIFKLAGLIADDYDYVAQADKSLIYQGVQDYLAIAAEDKMSAANMFVQGTTTDFREKYKLPMTGRTPLKGEEGHADNVAQTGGYVVDYPLYNYGDEINRSIEDAAYDSPQNFQMHIDGVMTRAANRYSFDVLKRIFNNTDFSFNDKRRGNLTVKPLANSDGTLYPPTIDSEDEAEANHYLVSGYTAANISDTNNPIEELVDLLALRWGDETGGIPVAVVISRSQRNQIAGLTEFVPVVDNKTIAGDDTDDVKRQAGIPGQLIGTVSGAWVSVWDRIPANYMAARHLGVDGPLVERNHPPGTLTNGLSLSDGPDNKDFPMLYNAWDLRFGIGTRNRLSAAVMFLDAGATYTIPTKYQ
jgi:hypothetical protein